MGRLLRIGEVSERTGLSLRTIRYYGEVGLAEPSARTEGGFRLYTDDDVERLLQIKRMKPLDLPLERMRELLTALDELDGNRPRTRERAELLGLVDAFLEAVERRSGQLREQLQGVEELSGTLRARLDRTSRPTSHGARH